jgi:hypothetical protein
VVNRPKCVICETRPAMAQSPYCNQCHSRIQRDSDERDNRKETPRYYLHYRGIVIGLYPIGECEDRQLHYRAQREHSDLENIPKSRVINIDQYQHGYTRDQIKKFKAACLSLGNVR